LTVLLNDKQAAANMTPRLAAVDTILAAVTWSLLMWSRVINATPTFVLALVANNLLKLAAAKRLVLAPSPLKSSLMTSATQPCEPLHVANTQLKVAALNKLVPPSRRTAIWWMLWIPLNALPPCVPPHAVQALNKLAALLAVVVIW